jgi:hypothetical protein
MSNKPLKVVFAPGCFDSFEGSQEELDSLTAEIQNMFADMTLEELEAQTVQLDENSLSESEWALLDAADAAHQVDRGPYLQ